MVDIICCDRVFFCKLTLSFLKLQLSYMIEDQSHFRITVI